jgi:hypothetical protein
MLEFKSVYSAEEAIFGERLSDGIREAQHRKNISDLRFYKWYLENRGTDESWSEMLQGLVAYMNDMERRAETEELDDIDSDTLNGWKILLEKGPMGLALSQFNEEEEPSE